MNTLGALFGAIFAMMYFKYLSFKIYYLLKKTVRKEPLVLPIVFIMGFQLVAAIVPFNVSITVSDLKKSVSRSNIIPFDYKPISETFGIHQKKLSKKPITFSTADFIEDIIYFAIYGYLTILCYFLYWRRKNYANLLLLILLFAAFPFIEFVQLFIISRISDINDILAGYSGIMLASFLFYSFKVNKKIASNAELNFSILKIPMVLYILFVFFTGLKPFTFTTTQEIVSLNLRLGNLVPFYVYFIKTSILNIYDSVETILTLVPLGLAFSIYFKNKISANKIIFNTFILSATIGFIIEIGQVFMFERTGEITDLLFYITGGLLGILVFHWNENELAPETDQEFDTRYP